ncbi:UDP-N-acetylmuramoyl-tripeptide--D-alanyl-D-alanine ligase [Oerskovia turbata]|uniref:UDP-N-acetylmuramoyl-tripeptide--D-alanyl-D-alanine ligase n=1 Tax=Oerskovia turbata TaxID=1713 RepID=A0A4Q1KZM7_9CELL|nr:UDP-N-acetylmuramoyl-tripeptide--D-alanyl-D-alanine ligase [Oerskovia turbata]RXR27805.1 UDP-N-acetylmuramoyl-tripeptide--D-alanyl-D-alanine ligase [Oerskovia turbata]RXR35757.1 UDP-N-acetylmuramoyl-tripeptide--D-alanyl-D-alanine ligase [Oerskovia turbata]TGJ96724.1 UDP-N-acetylmuramoyl-tripeptide--D-alanyl-D-alanine ligase [Actinotalea fermentans ATCC 43279 = JCM 9966 = DSM 3133]
MIELTAAEVAAATGGRLAADPDVRVTGSVVVDSRLVRKGALFVALGGEHVDGHDFVPVAVDQGAALVLAARDVDAPAVVVEDVQAALGALAREVLRRLRAAGDLQVVGITGSVGKTTTKDLLGQLLTPHGRTVVPRGSFNNEIGLPLTVLEADASTRYLVLEMGASGLGHLTYLTRIAPPDVSVVLAVGSAHLGEFGGIEAVATAKAEIVTGLAPGGTAVLNADDLRVVAMADVAPGPVVTFGTIPAADVRAENIGMDRAGCASFDLRVRGAEETFPVQLRLVGEHHVANALAAAAAAVRLGLEPRVVAAGLAEAAAISPHRMAVTQRADGITVIDDSYNANPDSMRAALKALAVMAGRERRSVAVLGEMRELGPDSRAAHDEIGRLVVRLNIKLLVVVGDGAGGIHDGATQEGSWGDETRFVPDVEAASALLRDELLPGDVVLVKSSNGSGLWRLGDELAGEVRA